MSDMTPGSWVALGVGAVVGFSVITAAALGLLVGALKIEDRQKRRNREATR